MVVPIQRWMFASDRIIINNSTRRLHDIRFRSADSRGVIYDCHYSCISSTSIVAINSHVLVSKVGRHILLIQEHVQQATWICLCAMLRGRLICGRSYDMRFQWTVDRRVFQGCRKRFRNIQSPMLTFILFSFFFLWIIASCSSRQSPIPAHLSVGSTVYVTGIHHSCSKHSNFQCILALALSR